MNFFKVVAFVTILASSFYTLDSRSLAAAPQDLRQAIEEKAKKLLEVNNQIQSTQKQLDAVEAQKNTLQKELKRRRGWQTS